MELREKESAPKWQGIIGVAAIFGLIGGGVAFVMYDYGLVGAVFIAALVAIIVTCLLAIGWREPSPTPIVTPGSAGVAPGSAGEVPGSATQHGVTPRAKIGAATAATAVPGSAGVAAGTAPVATPAEEDRFASATAQSVAPAVSPDTGATTPIADSAPAAGAHDAGAARPVAPDGKPELLDAPKEGGPDDLKQIRGVGPKLENMLHGMGIYHFDQIASWQAKEVAWVDQNLEGFKGRVSRDDWVSQARILASGGSTDFSGKVKKGDVY